jgi:hypothetical protein
MAGFFDALSDFFLGLLSGDPQAVHLRKQLKGLAHTIADYKPAVYNKNDQTLTPGLAASWFQLYQLLAPLSDLFSKTIGQSDRVLAELSLNNLLETVLDGEIAERRLNLSYASLSSRFSNAGNVDQEAVVVGQEFGSLINDIRRQDNAKWQQDFSALVRLRHLAGQSWAAFFAHFGYDLSTIGLKSATFRSAPADEALPELIDAYYLVGQLELGSGVEALIGLLLEKVSPSKAAENRQKVGKILEKVRDLLSGPCSASLTLTLIRLIKKDPDYVPDVLNLKERFVSDYANTLSEHFSSDRERALRERSESTLERDIEALFEGARLLPFHNYGSETNEKLNKVGLPALTWVKPLEVLRSFAYTVLRTNYLAAIKKVVLGGIFASKDWQESLSNDMYAAERIASTLEAFDASLAEEGKTTLVSLEKYLTGQVPPSATARQLVDRINHNASGVLESEVLVLGSLCRRVQEILNDYKAPNPHQVTNIKGLGGSAQRELIEALITGYNKSAQALKVLGHFVVVKP